MSTKSIVLLALLALAVFWTVGGYNRLMRLKNAIGDAFSAVDFQLKDRHDLLLKLAEASAEYLQYDPVTLSELSQARSDSRTAQDAVRTRPSHASFVQALIKAEQKLDNKLVNLWAAGACHSAMLADPKMLEYAQQLSGAQSKLAFGCQAFNISVEHFNAAQRQFPTLLIARLFGFTAAADLVIGLDSG